jgi:O-acetyl-ADP-ribose deacetylase (regulator of RNase III)
MNANDQKIGGSAGAAAAAASGAVVAAGTKNYDTKIGNTKVADAKAASVPSVPIMKVTEHRGDLFEGAGTDASLGHCVSRCFAMGKGIAFAFKRRFGAVNQLKTQNVGIGGVAVLQEKQRFVFYLVTKEKYWQKPSYESFTKSLLAMRDLCVKYGIKRLCLPRIGCGLDGLSWSQVLPLIKDAFSTTGCTVDIYYL